MAIRVALEHITSYKYDRLVNLSAHQVRLRPAPHARTPVLAYSLKVQPAQHFINWQQDPFGNYIARLVFPEPTDRLEFAVELIADLTVINPFDFFVEKSAETFPFSYDAQLMSELQPYLQAQPAGPLLGNWMSALRRDLKLDQASTAITTTDFLVQINQRVQRDIAYLVRMEPGVQTPEETLSLAKGSCRDSGWLLVQVMRHLGLAARFVSGYLIQLVADIKALDGPSGTTVDFTDLHAWTEVYIPGAGWVGLDPTSGLLAGEGHIPLACTAMPSSAAPVTGLADPAQVEFTHEMRVTRIHEDPRVTKPYSDTQWLAINTLGEQVEAELQKGDVRLTQGGEPTFVSIDDMESAQWNTAAHGDDKRRLAGALAQRLAQHHASGGIMHHGQGKWYPGEPLPRWALNLYWRTDGQALWSNPELLVGEPEPSKATIPAPADSARAFAQLLAQHLVLPTACVLTAYEDVLDQVLIEQKLPINLDASRAKLKDPEERRRLARLLEQGLGEPAGYVIPVKPLEAEPGEHTGWRTSKWPLRREHLYLVSGDSPMGLRLPLSSLPWVLPEDIEPTFEVDPFAERAALAPASVGLKASNASKANSKGLHPHPDPREVVHTACCVQVRDGVLYIFMPPLVRLEDSVALIQAIEHCAQAINQPVRLEGYPPPADPRLRSMSVTPDPGVIEVNIAPAASWPEICTNLTTLYSIARETRLGTEKFMLDGRHTGTGGGNHVTLGGATPADSPMLRRPDLLRSLITYWQNHPSLSYLFSGAFIGPTSQAPRVDEARDDALYELAIAFQQMQTLLDGEPAAQTPAAKAPVDRLWLVDRLLRNLLVDLTGNTHRSEFCIDKLYSPDSPTGRLGIVEFRAFEMPPHPQMALMQTLLLRTLVARFWTAPYRAELIHWGTELHDKWMLPYFVEQDIRSIALELQSLGYPFEESWFDPFVEFRYPRYGTVNYEGVELELRQAIEPWNVLGEEVSRSGTSRYVDSSVERMQVKVKGLTASRHALSCNGRLVPLHATGVPGEAVAGIRFRAWAPPSALHPTIKVQAPLVFDLIDTWSERSMGGCVYHVAHPGGRNYDTFPVNANSAEARRFARFVAHGHTPGKVNLKPEPLNPRFPMTLDLRWNA
jgi:uncharacterized protein (DUF2126 family)/transglutaminase-like putative cysteine protease